MSIKAYVLWREGRRITSHGEPWRYKDRVAEELGDRVRDAWYAGHAMHTCFYENLCTRGDVEKALRYAEKLVEEVEARVKRSKH